MGRSYGVMPYVRSRCLLMWIESHLQDHLGMTATINYGSGHAALRRSRFSMPHQIYHVTVVTKNRKPLFLDFNAACVAARCHHDSNNLKDSVMLAWVLMPDHAHWLLQLGEQDTLQKLVTRLKCASARHVNRELGCNGALWGRAFHEHALRDHRQLLATARYLVANPLRAGLVNHLSDYPFWNSIWL